MNYDDLIKRAKEMAERQPNNTIPKAFLFILAENKRLQKENDEMWHRLNPESMGR
jgi:hypothetical protein